MKTISLIVLQAVFMVGCFSLNMGTDQSSQQKDSRVDPYLPVWTAMDPETIERVISDRLGVTRSDPEGSSILDSLSAKRATLGEAQVGSQLPQNLAADPIKFRHYSEIYFNSCYFGMHKPEIRQKYFATTNWSRGSFDKFYQSMLGRFPSAAEKEILYELVSRPELSTFEKKATGVCTAVLSSIEFTNSR